VAECADPAEHPSSADNQNCTGQIPNTVRAGELLSPAVRREGKFADLGHGEARAAQILDIAGAAMDFLATDHVRHALGSLMAVGLSQRRYRSAAGF
jgi:hypothetical protein